MKGRPAVHTVIVAVLAAVLVAPSLVSAQGPAPAERIAALKQSMQESQARLRTYEWIETTAISMKGEVKSTKQNRCYYGAEGKVQKVPLESAAPQAAPQGGGGGRRGARVKAKVVENKKEEISDYMKKAAALVHQYVPPDAARIQAAKDAGKAKMSMVEPGKRARIEFADYLQAGDSLAIEINPQTNHLLSMHVASYLDSPEDAVRLNVQFADLPDGTTYQSSSTLDAPAKNVSVKIENSGHRPVGR
jgi:hypothetical protein